jgi:hypothetical protein
MMQTIKKSTTKVFDAKRGSMSRMKTMAALNEQSD